MACQGVKASMPRTTAKAVLRPVGRNLAMKAIGQRLCHNHALMGVLGGLVPLFKRRITVHGPSPRFPKVG